MNYVDAYVDAGENELTPWAEAKVAFRIKKSYSLNVFDIDAHRYQVDDKFASHVVDLTNRICSCKKWQLSGLPCNHVIAVSRFINKTDLGIFVEKWFKKSTYRATYEESINPVGDIEAWDTPAYVTPVLPPVLGKRSAGRPKNKDRIPSKGEIRREPYCTRCTKIGHSKDRCQKPTSSQRSAYGWG